MFNSIEIQIALYVICLFVLLNLLSLIVHFLYKSLSDSKLREMIRTIIFALDEFADNMENEQKKKFAIQNINDLLGWKKIFIPSALIGFVIDLQVKAIRKTENITNTPNLHE